MKGNYINFAIRLSYIFNVVIILVLTSFLFRYLRKLKNNVRNKAKVEGSICNAYLVEEASSFCAYYFEPHINTRHRRVPRNVECGVDVIEGMLSVFKPLGRPFGRGTKRLLTEEESRAAHQYILLNCEEVKPYIE